MNIKISILTKMCIVVMTLIVGAIWFVSQSSSNIYGEALINGEEYSNMNNATLKSKEAEVYFEGLMKKTKAYSEDIVKSKNIVDKEIVQITFVGLKKDITANNKEWLKENKMSKKVLAQLSNKISSKKKLGVYNLSQRNFPVLGAFIFPVAKEGKVMAVVIFDLKFLQKKVKSGKSVNYITNFSGEVIAHSIDEEIFSRKTADSIVLTALNSKQNQRQTSYTDKNQEEQVAAYYKSNKYQIISFTKTPKSIILEPVKRAKNKAIYIAGIVISLSIFIIFLLSLSLTRPIRKISSLFDKVAKGDFTVSSGMTVSSLIKDETTAMIKGFDQMMKGLRDGEKVRNLMNKLQGQEIADDLLDKELKIGGDKKEVVVFFSDIRGFTSYTENNEAEEVISMLNGYLEVMVGIILNRKGVVDKFIGDAIMAAWGVPTAQKDSNKNAVMACLEMRQGLMSFNEKRIKEGKEPIMIGMGLHRGPVISGLIGSEQRAEYTVIGDTVNQAARIEEGTKAFGTDLLISEEVYQEIKDDFVIEEAGKVSAKGKAKPLTLYKVLGYIKDGQEYIVKTPYSEYEAKEGGKVKKTA